jgi:hypothetical protein
MSRHLKSCLAEHQPSRGESARIFRLRIEDAYSPVYWMDVEMKARSTLEDLDDFLRGEWLECCGHLSDFDIDGIIYSIPNAYDDGPFGMVTGPSGGDMKVKLGKILNKRTCFYHTNDFGSSTELKLRVMDERQGRRPPDRAPVKSVFQNLQSKGRGGRARSTKWAIHQPDISSFLLAARTP